MQSSEKSYTVVVGRSTWMVDIHDNEEIFLKKVRNARARSSSYSCCQTVESGTHLLNMTSATFQRLFVILWWLGSIENKYGKILACASVNML